MSSDSGILDHIIVLLPHDELLNPPKWLTDKFTLTNGGRHADGKTENKLIVLQDGSYIELISFIDDIPSNREGHWWCTKPYSIIDWCLTTKSDYNNHHEDLTSRFVAAGKAQPSNNGVLSYAKPQLGGRLRPDGVKLEWAVTFPTLRSGSGDEEVVSRPPNLPFFCHDVTPRENRVNGATTHPCGALGIKEFRILVGEDTADEYAYFVGAAVNAPVEGGEEASKVITVSSFNGGQSKIVISKAQTDEEKELVKERKFVLSELVFNVDQGREEATFRYPT